MRALADPNVLVAAAISKGGACARLLLLAEQGAFQLVASSELFNELEEVLLRTKFRRYVTVEEVRRYLELLRSMVEMAGDPPGPPPRVTPDPDDDYLVALARFAAVDVLISGDPHLTELTGINVLVRTPRAFQADLVRDAARSDELQRLAHQPLGDTEPETDP